MSALLYIIKRTFYNTIKRIVKKPLILIAYILALSFVILILVLSFLDTFNGQNSYELFYAIIFSGLILYSYFSLKTGIDKGSSFFRAADVSLLFTSPISADKILIYGFLKQLAQVFFISFIVLIQTPNLKRFFTISRSGILLIIAGLILYMLTLPIVSMIMYSYSSKSHQRRRTFKRILNIVFILIIAWILFSIIKEQSVLIGFTNAMSHKALSYIPVIGWSTSIISAAVGGITNWFYFSIVLSLLLIAALIFVLYNMEKDYYEDALVSTENKEVIIKQKKEGTFFGTSAQTKFKRINFRFTAKGAAAIFQKNILESRKTGFFLFDKASIMVIAFAIVSRIAFYQGTILFTLFLSAYILFLTSIKGRWAQELSKHYIYLIPVRNVKKLFYATAVSHLKNLIDGIVLFLIVGILYQAAFTTMLLCVITYTSFGSIYLYGDIVGRKLFGQVHLAVLHMFFKIIILLFLIAPGIIMSIIILSIYHSEFLAILATLSWNLLVTIILMIPGSTLFKNIEMA